jgi:hypothetical protein
MAETTVPTALRVKQWDDNFFEEYIRTNRFSRYMGTSEDSFIQVRENLMKKPGDTIYFELVNRLQGSGKTDNQTLEGFEEDLSQRSDSIKVHLYRHGVVVPEYEEQVTAISLRNAAKSGLKSWSMEHTRDRIINKLADKEYTKDTILNPFGNVQLTSAAASAYVTANATNLNTWLQNNQDRTQFGAVVSNYSSGVFATALGTIDTTADKLNAAAVSLMKRKAKVASPKIRPIKVNGDEEWYMLFCNPYAFRDLKTDSTMTQANRDARVRGTDNPLFTDGDLLWDGVIIREIPELIYNVWTGQGSSADVGEVYLCGAQGMGFALAQRWNTRTQDRDYETKHGVAIQQIYDVKKLAFGTGSSDTTTPKDYGVLTGYFTAQADA